MFAKLRKYICIHSTRCKSRCSKSNGIPCILPSQSHVKSSCEEEEWNDIMRGGELWRDTLTRPVATREEEEWNDVMRGPELYSKKPAPTREEEEWNDIMRGPEDRCVSRSQSLRRMRVWRPST